MILRCNALFSLALLCLLWTQLVLADDFDCKPTLEGNLYDFTSLGNGAHIVNRTRQTPPTQTVDSLAFDLCGDLQPKEGFSEQEQCPTGTRACLTQVNIKENDVDRILSVIPLAQTAKLEPKLTINLKSPQYLTLLFHGPDYPPTESTPSTAQSLQLTLWCDPQMESPNITIDAYGGSRLDLVYFGPAGCPVKKDSGGKDEESQKPGDNKGEEPAGSGIGWFFLLLLLAFFAYFAIGAYYNYSTYGARGLDLIPHRDFWQEVPYMISDVVAHMCSSARPRRSARGGYISV